LNLGDSYVQMKQYHKALELYQQFISKITEESEGHPLIAEVQGWIHDINNTKATESVQYLPEEEMQFIQSDSGNAV
jgi:hypothetical protein